MAPSDASRGSPRGDGGDGGSGARGSGRGRAAGVALATSLLVACGARTEPAPLTIAAASSLRELVLAASEQFAREHPGAPLRASFDASSTLARQIDAGMAFDVFLSADADTAARVRDRLQADTLVPFLENRLALVGRADLQSPPRTPAELLAPTGEHAGQPKGRIAVAGPAVPAGKYTRAWLASADLLAPLAPRLVDADNVRAALALVEAGAADFAFVYRTDAAVAKRAQLLWVAPEGGADDAAAVVYVAAAVAGAPPRAAAFVRWLQGPAFRALAEQHGFLPPPR